MSTELVQFLTEHGDDWMYCDGELAEIGPTFYDPTTHTYRQIAEIAVFAPELAAILHGDYQLALGDEDRALDTALHIERLHDEWLYLK